MISRREFALATLSGSLIASSRTASIGLQLFSVRRQCEADLAGTLSRVAIMGFRGVELAGYYGHKPEEIRRLLADCGLECCGAHVPLDLLLEPKRMQTVEFHRALGNATLVVPGLPAHMVQNNEGWLRVAHVFTDISESLHTHGMRLGYHNHAVEFRGDPGVRPWDLFFSSTGPDVFIELDIGGAGYGGADPISLLKRYPGRVRLVHVKDYAADKPDLMIGEGAMDWRDFFPVCSKIAGAEWLIIEHDSDPTLGMADIAECLRRFRKARSMRTARAL
jgi:sugar phosphate isomerase/epimerase